ncbi:MAG: Mov34/MPN/PAD-1 family protein [Candidatus Micrarchaeota archaeon]|nr:Mov34/MPN/PAD-1 family protein [Candidatus Micrarchaeota archaeon]
MEILIKRQALLSALAGAKSAHPNEFLCLLIGREEDGNIFIEDTLIPPGIRVFEHSSYYSEWMQPLISGVVGTFHSHPNGEKTPSKADKELFWKKGGINMIAAYPYSLDDVAAYLGGRKMAELKITD